MLFFIIAAALCAGTGTLTLFAASFAESRANDALLASRAASNFIGDGNPTNSFFALRARHDRLHRLSARLLIVSAIVCLAATGFAVYAVGAY
ncbi:hypothetical protein ACFWM1_30050 [Nocardia sp. NPDC058379]|uniref:hypothetical protein n=1 Tax=unclassified Nocardia TaxID=2637762 RepID=UPI0036536C7A